ncbi:hypothetical protein [Lysobacter antibioticus]|uniref:hypothetical protein n=1 Tax=Lysobacter antibioticus TaxID=84531 RepID=UPI00165124C2|nr:hypothetical protein [Lysobacter antibioticus]
MASILSKASSGTTAIADAMSLALALALALAVVLVLALAPAVAVAMAVAVRHRALAKAIEDPEGGAQGCAPFFIGTGMSRMKNPRVGTERAGL